MKFAQNIPGTPIGFSNKDISVTLGIYTALDQKFKKKKSTASMPTSGREPADLYFLTPRFAPPFLSILPYPAGQKYSGLLGAQKRGTPKPFGQSVPLFIWSELIQNVVVPDVKQQDQRLAVVFPDHPDVHVHTELEQIGCSLDPLGSQGRIQWILHQQFQLLFQLRTLRSIQSF